MIQGELFLEVIRRIKPSENEREKARGRRDHVLKILDNQDLGISGVRSYGSYAKRTGIQPLNDLDVIAFISPEKYPKQNPESILRILARDIRPSFPNNEIVTGNRSVKVNYVDGFSVDIVPAFSIDRKNLEPAEILDRKEGTWIETSPSKHIEFANLVSKLDGRYKNLVRIFKIWKNIRRRVFRSIVIELLITDAIFDNKVPKGWAEAVYSIFKYVDDHGLNKKIYFTTWHPRPSPLPNDPVVILDPVNMSNNVADDFTINSKNEFMNAWSQDTKIAYKALNSRYKTDIIDNWKKIFGKVVPSRY